MKTEFQNHVERSKRYNNIDGTAEIIFGVMALGYGLLGYLQAVLPKDSPLRYGSGMLLFWGIVLLMLGLILWIPKVIKKRITWPRTGYVKFRPHPAGKTFWWIWLVGVAACSAILGASIALLVQFDRRHDWMGLVWMGNSFLYAACYGWWIYQMKDYRPWKWLVLLFTTLGLLAMAVFAPANFPGLWSLMLVVVGLVWLGSGGATLCLYMRHTPPPALETE